MALTANTLDLSAGTIDISIYSTQFTVSDTFEVLDFGDIEYIHDVPDGAETDASVVRSILGTLKIQAYDIMDGGNSLWEQLFKVTDAAFVVVDYVDNNDVSKPFYFSFRDGDFSVTSQTQKIEIKFTSIPKDLFTAVNTYNTIKESLESRGVSGGLQTSASNRPTVDGAGQTGLTINTTTLNNVPSDGDVIYFGSTTGQAYVVDSATSTSITFKYEVETAPADGAEIYSRNKPGFALSDSYLDIPNYIINGISDRASSAYLFVKILLEDIVNEIPNALDDVYSNEIVINSLERNAAAGSGDIFRVADESTTLNESDIFVRIQNDAGNVRDNSYHLLSRISAIMGCFFGFGFGKTWFVPRVSTDGVITLSLDDMLSLEFEIPDQNFGLIELETLQTVYSGSIVNYAVYSDNYTTNLKDSEKFFKYTGSAVNACIGELFTNVGPEVDTDTSITTNFQLAQNWGEIGLASYACAKGHSLAPASFNLIPNTFDVPLTIEFEVYGVNTILPYEPIQFDTSVDDEFQGNIYRPFEISYNFVKNTVSGKAYKIA